MYRHGFCVRIARPSLATWASNCGFKFAETASDTQVPTICLLITSYDIGMFTSAGISGCMHS